MKTYLIGLLAVGIVLGSDRLLLADKPNVDELTGAKPAPERTPEQREGVYAQVLDPNQSPGAPDGQDAHCRPGSCQAAR